MYQYYNLDADTMGLPYFDYGGWENAPDSGSTPSTGSGGGWGGDDWRHLIDRGFNAASQIFSAWGRRPTQQTGYGGRAIGGGYSPAEVARAEAEAAAARNAYLRDPLGGTPDRPGNRNSLDGIFNSLTKTLQENPMIFAAGALGLYLLMREPPRRR